MHIRSLAFFLLPVLAYAQATYQIDPVHSSVQFAVRHMMVTTVRGDFNKVQGTIIYDANNLEASSVEATIDINSINTREPKRDEHLKSADFFDVAKYPTMTFKSKQFFKEGGKLKLKGDLGMHGVTKEIVLNVDGPAPEVKGQRGEMRTGAAITGTLSRKEWGLTWNRAVETGGVAVSDEVQITIDIAAVRK